MSICDSCGCPAISSRTSCPWCDFNFDMASPVTFELERSGSGSGSDLGTGECSWDRFNWIAEGSVVAAGTPVHGLWQIVDARGHHVVTLMPLSKADGDERPTIGLIGPSARMLGSIQGVNDGCEDAIARDEDGHTVLVMRGDGPGGSHIVDRYGDVVAVASWGERSAVTDLLVTANGTRQSLALVFSLVLANELSRHAPHRLV